MDTRTTITTPPDAVPSPRSDEIKRKEAATIIAAYKVSARVYKLAGIDTTPVRFFVLGCHGNGEQAQKDTAALMNKIAQELENSGDPTPAFILFLGDNIYDYGVSSPFDTAFNECFHNIYYDIHLSAINKLPCWLLLGNHDFNMHSKAWMGRFGAGESVAMKQVGHTYIANTVESIEKKAGQFENKKLSPEMLAHWNMPYMFYSLIAGNTQIFCLDSNNFLADYLELLNGNVALDGTNKKTGHINQAAWFFTEYAAAKAKGRQIFIAQHHPLFVSGKRALREGFDWKHYINETQLNDLIAKLKAKNPDFVETKSYNELIAAVFQQEGIDPDLVFAAHEHFLSYYNDATNYSNIAQEAIQPILRQCTSGGGGGDLQKRMSYKGHPYVSMFQKHNGFTMVTCDPANPKTYTLDFYTTEGLHLRFREDSHRPIMNAHPDPQIEILRNCVISTCDRYFTLLKNAELQRNSADNNAQNKTAENSGMFSSAFRMFSDTFTSIYHAAATLMDHLNPNSNSEIENSAIQDIQAYFSQLDLPDSNQVIAELFKLTRTLPYRLTANDYTFYSMLQRTVKSQTGLELQSLFNQAGLRDLNISDNNILLPAKT